MTGVDRYQGKPFLKLLDSYVLMAIGALPDDQSAFLTAMESKLCETFGSDGSWQQIVADQMEFPDDLPEKINLIWENGSARMREAGIEPDPLEFARQFVDTNFPIG